ncbi:MAG: 6-bladed beta-propeller [Candidatus Delongbacteria bacterium]|nr:6-bladed beta-propeller [Candidatus Delongbacteria bacterium]MBN2836025.1 6-bladed beta-propeller [Candidatus Delongbacteria bacterium]
MIDTAIKIIKIILIVLITSCTSKNDVKVVDLKVSDHIQIDSLYPEMKSLYDFCVDDDNSIYILDYGKRNIYIIDELGNNRSFGAKGTGPGEFLSPGSLYLFNNHIYVYDIKNKSINIFAKNGDFINREALDFCPRFCQELNDTSYIGFNFDVIEKANKLIMTSHLVRIGQGLFRQTIVENNICESSNGISYYDDDVFFPFTIDKKNGILFYAPNSRNDFKVIRKDTNSGEEQIYLSKPYLKIPYSEKDNENRMVFKIGNVSDETIKKDNYKKSINNLFLDSDGRLFIQVASKKDSITFEVYENSNLIEIINIDYPDGDYIVKMSRDKIYILDRERNIILVYSNF